MPSHSQIHAVVKTCPNFDSPYKIHGTGYKLYGGPFETMSECEAWCKLNPAALPATVRWSVMLNAEIGGSRDDDSPNRFVDYPKHRPPLKDKRYLVQYKSGEVGACLFGNSGAPGEP